MWAHPGLRDPEEGRIPRVVGRLWAIGRAPVAWGPGRVEEIEMCN